MVVRTDVPAPVPEPETVPTDAPTGVQEAALVPVANESTSSWILKKPALRRTAWSLPRPGDPPGHEWASQGDGPRTRVLRLAGEALTTFASTDGISLTNGTFDSGPAVLARLLYECTGREAKFDHESVLEAWLGRFPYAEGRVGLFGGLGALLVGARVASVLCPRLVSLVAEIENILASPATAALWKAPAVDWSDYDLVSGPSGVLLALISDATCQPNHLQHVGAHLDWLCKRDDMESLRITGYGNDPDRSWNCGRVNSGLAHGVTGMVAALRSACEISDELCLKYEAALRRSCAWLVKQAYVDSRGIRTVPIAGLDGAEPPIQASRRQAWCYGTPGVAWSLWEAGQVLGDHSLRSFAEEAMDTFCRNFDIGFHIDPGAPSDALGFCHGVAGILAVTDCFERHAGHTSAAELAIRLEEFLFANITGIRTLATENMTLLSGASGVLAVMLMRLGGSRQWLSQVALR